MIENYFFLPFWSSSLLIIGMLTQLAAETATKGTSLPTNGGKDFTMAFKPRAVTRAPPVAAT